MSLTLTEVSVSLDGVPILHEISLHVANGAWVSLIGPNGAGKSTLLRAAMRLVPSEGRIEFDGTHVDQLDRRSIARSVAYVPQDPARPAGMTVSDFVLLGRTPHLRLLGSDSALDLERAFAALGTLGLDGLADRDVSSLSGGEAQRAVIARALAQEPQLLIMDEPTAALDLAAQLEVMETIDDLRSSHGIAVLSSTHDLTLAARFVDVVHLIAGGRIVESGLPRDVLTAEKIAAHYGAEVRVLTDPDGGLIVAPRRSPRR